MFRKILICFLILFTIVSSVPLLSGNVAGADVTIDDIISTASEIIRINEGFYHSVNPDDNDSLSIGWVQWHGTRALNLLKDIVAANPSNAKRILGTALYKEITTATQWSTRILTTQEAKKISTLISTKEGKKEQDKLAAKDISGYINRAMGYGIKDPTALVFYADIENQCGAGGAKPTVEAAKKLAGSYKAIKLTHLYKAAIADRIAGEYATRRQRTYNNCLLVKWETVGSDLEVWNIQSARNVRSTPNTESTLITTLAGDTKVVVSEKVAFGNLTRGKTSMGWITLDSASCTLNTKLSGGTVPAPVIFDTDGGSFNAKSPASTKVSGVNRLRTSNTFIVYTNAYTSKNTPTNAYGYECTVDKNGLVLNTPTYGVCKSEIPKGGLVLSAVGTKSNWLTGNVKKGCYVRFDEETSTLSVYKSLNDLLALTKTSVKGSAIGQIPTPEKNNYYFTGWTDENKKTVNAKTVCNSPFCIILTANWEKIDIYDVIYNTAGGTFDGTVVKEINGINTSRPADTIIVYKNKASTNTNMYGREAVVDKNGKVTSVSGYGTGNSKIPSGGFVISGVGTGSEWISENLSVNMRVVLNEADKTITVYESGTVFDNIHKSVKERSAIGTLPTASRKYHKFLGWYTSKGTKISGSTLMPDGGLTVTAKWEVIPGKLSFNANGGTVKPKISTFKVSGTNVHRKNNTLVIYKDKKTTETNIYGTEVLVGSDGIVDAVFPYGAGNNKIPEGSYILSGSGTASTWLKTNVSRGNYITLNGSTVTVWKSYSEYSASLNKSVTYGKKYGILPTPEREGYYFAGWTAPDGKTVTSSTTAAHYGNVTLKAKWEKLLTVTFKASGGNLNTDKITAKAKGINVPRTLDSLVIYAGVAATGTNKHGTEAVISADGIVTAVKKSGNTAIPAGSIVLSGNGKMSTWITNNVKAGNYVIINGYTVTVFESKAAYDAFDGKIFARKGIAIGTLAKAKRNGYTFVGWYAGSQQYTEKSTVGADTALAAKWAKSTGTVVFDLQGGKTNGAVGSYKLNGVNSPRKADTLILYNSNYTSSTTNTNAYGSECIVGSNGTVSTTPKYGTCKTAIPKSGFVLSGIGKGHKWLTANVKAGYYIYYNKGASTVTSYRSYGDYLAAVGKQITYNKTYGILPTPTKAGYIFVGWKNSQGIIVTSTTKVPDCSNTKLTAVWQKLHSITLDTAGGQLHSAETALFGTNKPRLQDTLVLYKNKVSTGTNKYGREILVSSTGMITAVYAYGKGNSKIPSGCYVLSGNGTMSTWIYQNLSVGKYIEIKDGVVRVYNNEAAYKYATQSITVPDKEAVGALPTPKKYGYTFVGWYNGSVKVSNATKITANTKLTASWKGVLVSLVFDTDGGAISPEKNITANGINVHRSTNAIIIYNGADSKTSTGTNKYGTEVIVNSAGTVTEIRPYGKGNTPIPDGGYVISGNGVGSDWIKANVSVGNYVVTKGKSITVYKNIGHYYGVVGKSLYVGKTFGALPTPTRAGYTFDGWFTPDGKKASNYATVPPAEGKLVLVAKWTKNS